MTIISSAQGGHEGILLLKRPIGDVFEGDTKGAARRMRDTAIPDTRDFDNDERLAIVVRFRDKEIWQVRRGGAWVDVCVMTTDEDDDE